MSRERIPITPSVLTWARERACYTLEEFGNHFREIDAWEKGLSSPTYPQLEKLSERLAVPVAVFFFPEPPDVPPLQDSFRTLPEVEFGALPRRLHFLLRKAQALQLNLSELNEGRNPAEKFILGDLRFATDMDIREDGWKGRQYLDVPLAVQRAWADTEYAFDAWRDTLEAHGIAVFKDAFRADAYSGFCLYDEVFPLIYVNNSVKTRQIFTLFHELAHLLFHTSGIISQTDEFDEDLPQADRQVEVVCNRFAAEFLLPEVYFERETHGLPRDERTAEQIAATYHVSREFVFRRFLDRGEVSQEEYLEAANRWNQQRNRRSGSGGNPYWTKIAYLGTPYIGLAFSRYYQNRIAEPELADYLDTKVKNLAKLEGYYARKLA